MSEVFVGCHCGSGIALQIDPNKEAVSAPCPACGKALSWIVKPKTLGISITEKVKAIDKMA